MENYENISVAFKEMLKRTKIMKDRFNDLRRTMNENTSEFSIKNGQYCEMQLECDGISASIGYLNTEIMRTIIMLKIGLYRQRIEKNNQNNEITITSSDKSNGFVERTKIQEKSLSISGRRNDCRNWGRQTNLEHRRIYTSSLHRSSSKMMKTSTLDSINNRTIEIEFQSRKQSEFMNWGTTFRGNSESIGSKKFTKTGYVLIFFVFLFGNYKLPESRKTKCKMRRMKLFLFYLFYLDC